MDSPDRKKIKLLLAVDGKDRDTVENLLKDGVKQNFMITNTENGIGTPLHVAVSNSDPELVHILLKNGAKFDVTCDGKATAWELAKQKGNGEVLTQFESYFEEVNEYQKLAVGRPSENYFYYRRPGTACISGQLFESKLLALLLLRLKESNCAFHLGSNVDSVGLFDDIVVRYFCKKDKKDKLIFLQTKHRQDPEKRMITLETILDPKNERGVYSIYAYFKSYLILKEKFSNDAEHIFNGNFEDLDIELALYTTSIANLSEDLNVSSIVNPLLETNKQGKVFQFKNDQMVINKICEQAEKILKGKLSNIENSEYDNNYEKLASDFLKKFKIYYNQANEENVGKIIVSKIGGTNPQLLYLIYHDLVQAHWMKTDQVAYLTEKIDLLGDARGLMDSQPMLVNFTEICYNTSQRYQLEYTDDSVISLGLDHTQRVVVNVYSNTPVLSFAKISSYYKRKLGNSLAIVDINQVGIDCAEILSNFLNFKTFNQMIMFCTTLEDCEKVRDVQPELLESAKRIIVVSNEDFCEKLSCLIPELHKVCDTRTSLADVRKHIQDKILDTKTVAFQGRSIKLLDLLGETQESGHISRKFITGSILLSLLLGDSFEMAPIINKQIEYYINRKFKRFDKVEELKKTNTLFIIDETNEVENHTDLVVVSDSKEKYDQVCKENPARNVHWFVKRSQYFAWQRSSNNLDNVRGILKYNDEELHETFNDRVVIIAAEPGMGKSTMLTELMNDTKIDGITWLVRINLINFTKQFQEMENKTIDLDVAENFLYKASEFAPGPEGREKRKDISELDKQVFQRCYNKGKVFVLVDGFDEIVPNYAHPVLELLKALKNSKARHLIVTTRDNIAKKKLEDQLKVFSHTIMPFTDKNINEFLEKYWKMKIKNKTWNQILFQNFSSELIQQYYRSASNKFVHDNSFISNPLHIEMIADCTLNTFEQFHNTGNKKHLDKLKNELNLSSLYNKFIEIKINDIYLGNKNSVKAASLLVSDNNLLELFNKEHMRLALIALFTKKVVKKLLSSEEFPKIQEDLDKVEKGKEKRGFVNQVVDGKPQFTHQTFAEYFAAQAIWEAIKQSPMYQFKSIVEDVLFNDLIINDKEQICRFVQTLALSDTKSIERISDKVPYLLTSFKSHAFRYKEKSFALLLSLIECNLRNRPPELLKLIESHDDKYKSYLLKASAMMGYLDLVRLLTNNLTIGYLGKELENGLWNESPFLLAVENHCDEVVKTFVHDFGYNVTWLDNSDKSLFSVWLHEKKYSCIKYLLDLGISDLEKMYGYGQLPLYEALRAKETPQELIETLLHVTDVNFFNKNALPSVDWYLLGYDISVTKELLEKGFHLQQSNIGIRKEQGSPTWEIYSNDYNGQLTRQEKRPALDVFSPQFKVWIERMEFLCKNGVGFHQESLDQIKKIYCILNILIKSVSNNWEQMLLKAIIANPSCKTVQLGVKRSDESYSIHLWFNDVEKIDLSNKVEECVEANILAAHENGSLQTADKTNILELLDLNENQELEEDEHDVVSDIIRYEAIGMLTDALQLLRDNQIQTEELQKSYSKLTSLIQLMETIILDWNKLINAVENNSEFSLPVLNYGKTVINCANKKYGSVLHYGVYNNNYGIVRNLLENQAHANIEVNSFNPQNLDFTDDINRVFKEDITTPMHIAAARGHLDIIKILIEMGANINYKTCNKLYTPLHMAACEGHVEVVQYLKDNKAIINFENVDKKTALELAKKLNQKSVIKILTP